MFAVAFVTRRGQKWSPDPDPYNYPASRGGAKRAQRPNSHPTNQPLNQNPAVQYENQMMLPTAAETSRTIPDPAARKAAATTAGRNPFSLTHTFWPCVRCLDDATMPFLQFHGKSPLFSSCPVGGGGRETAPWSEREPLYDPVRPRTHVLHTRVLGAEKLTSWYNSRRDRNLSVYCKGGGDLSRPFSDLSVKSGIQEQCIVFSSPSSSSLSLLIRCQVASTSSAVSLFIMNKIGQTGGRLLGLEIVTTAFQ